MASTASAQDRKDRPNTGVPLALLAPNIVLCCGEDWMELLEALRAAGQNPDKALAEHQYRCYKFLLLTSPSTRVQYTLAWGPIGTGGLEPWVGEILRTGIVRRIVLVGTAGFLGTDPSQLGKAYIVSEAYPVGCAVHMDEADLPLRPRFSGLVRLGLPQAATISTDMYYGCSPGESEYAVRARAADPLLRVELQKHWQSGRLLEMETAALYRFCRIYDLSDNVEFVSIRGVANRSDQFDEQTQYAHLALTSAITGACKLLRL